MEGYQNVKDIKINIGIKKYGTYDVDYIKNNLVSWNSNMKKFKGKTGAAKAQLEFTKAVLEKISMAYPKYADECRRQIDDLS